MAVPTLRALLAELDKTNHAGRTRRIALLARDHRDDPKLAKLLDGLTTTSGYHAQLALLAAKVNRDFGRLTALTEHPIHAVRASAMLALPLDDLSGEEFTQRYLDAPLATRRLLVRKANQARRRDLVSALLSTSLSDVDKATLLAHAESATAESYLSDLGDLIPNLAAFARNHPTALLDELASRLDAPPPVREETWAWITPALNELAAAEPDRLLGLLNDFPPALGLPNGPYRFLAPLAKADPSGVARLLAHSSRTPTAPTRWGQSNRPRLAKALRRQLRKLPAEERELLARHYHHNEAHLAAFLDALPPADRAAAFTAAFTGVNAANRVWSDELLNVLPRETREAEARRIAALPENRGLVSQVTWAGFLAPDEAEPVLKAQLRASEADERGAAWTSLLSSAGRSRDPEVLTTALTQLERLANEQDPVRYAAAIALVGLSPSLLAATPIEPLQAFASAVAQARDTSATTLQALQNLAWKLIEQAASAGTDLNPPLILLETLTGPDGVTSVPWRLQLPTAAIPAVVAALLPRMHAQARRHDFRLPLALWQSLGRRAWPIPQLNALMAAALATPSDHWQRAAAQAWLQPPQYRGDRVAALLRIDETFATLPEVQQVLCRNRQDLVEVCFRPAPLKGRFWKRVRFVAVLDGPFHGWLPRQIEAYADALEGLIGTANTPDYTRRQAVTTIGQLPGIGAARLAPYLASDKVVEQEAALAALAWSDDPGSMLETLLAYRSDDRARVALYTAGRCALHRQPTQAARLLDEVLADPSAKVTARKEAVRLIGQLRVPGSLDVLATLGANTRVHLDVRIAATRTLRHFLDDDGAWMVLENLAVAGRDATMSLIRTLPSQLAVRHRARFAQLLALTASGGDPEAIEALGAWARWAPRLAEQVARLANSRDLVTAEAATRAVRIAASAATDWTPFLQAVESLAKASAALGEPSAEASADQPSRQRLGRLVRALRPRLVTEAAWHRERLTRLAATLDAHPELVRLSWQVRLTAIDWTAPTGVLLGLAGSLDPLRTGEVRGLVHRKLVIATSQGIEPELDEAVAALIARGDAPSGGLALALVEQAGEQAGWSERWRRQLRTLRAHPVPAVAAWARETYTVEC
ncbi:hypothetical protein [Propionicimonas sp.]|uniref:hypothetical protein n=1 Tax=Propionicimonas sp. TaxID=1955623 RepID=UPI0017B73303|nr:hypothetical protein [Propionicimonas sp.]MBU3976397.1 hypothetical protein [Actinomycetota bacterium]MBA3022010.1 hypothetical protein [Propionicimonas sp.]MBU3987554.1 hypothetical protein [Actinomycetota bacterium]MBU4006501.1 hypothetical protein [Actinomycetota bacterium]MBU4065106.1 hypothetical protein [Actinomycetota bacterium]